MGGPGGRGSPFYEVISQKIFNFTKDGFPKFILLFPINLFHLSLGIQPSNIHIVGKVSRKQVIVGCFIISLSQYLNHRWHCAIPWPKATRPTWQSCQRQGEAFLHKATHVWSSQGLVFLRENNLKKNFQNLLWSPWTVPTPAGAAAPSHSTLVANQLEKVRKIGWICNLNAKISWFQIQLSPSISSANNVLFVLKEEREASEVSSN